jgi:VWFA-related protein
LAEQRIEGYDSIVLVPPVADVVFGLWRAEALVTGSRIERVKFFLDGKQIMSRKGPPFSAELRLSEIPEEHVVRVEGYDAARQMVGADEVVLNQPRGELRVRIIEPARGTRGTGPMMVRAEVVVPEEKKVEKLEIKVNEEVRATLERPPWEAEVQIPEGPAELTYITVAAQLDDGLRAEDVRFVNAPEYLEEVDVNLVELYTTVTDRSGQLVQGLGVEAFEVFEDGRPQKVAKFELVENLPLSLGLAIDVSGSMFDKMGEAQRTAIEFLDNIITPRDRVFALAFADRPEILMPRTSDVGAIAERVKGLVADGATSLHDAVVTSLYYYRGIRGRRALVLLSDGEDTSSTLAFREALEYARRSGVAIYAIGLGIGKADFGVRNKLDDLANQTGGRTFYITRAEELPSVYAQIETELRSQYLVAYNSDSKKPKDEYREIELEVDGGKLKARTIRGYYP